MSVQRRRALVLSVVSLVIAAFFLVLRSSRDDVGSGVRGLWLVLALVWLAIAGFHGLRALREPEPEPEPEPMPESMPAPTADERDETPPVA